MLFGKNSDRQRNEAQAVEFFSRADHDPGAALKCTYITIPQVERTHAVLLCRPFWVWGAEMGANEHSVAVGNEAVFARLAPPVDDALTGLDLVRLALERAATAADAVQVIVGLLELHGQGGNCGHLREAYYHNSFMIADPCEAFVLETIGREWVLERVRGVRAISNAYSIGRDVERTSEGLRKLIVESGWSADAELHYANAIKDPKQQHIGSADARRKCSASLLTMHDGTLSALEMMRILREHGSGDGYQSRWQVGASAQRTVCLHAGAVEHSGQTVGSLVAELAGRDSVHWVTGTAAPCMSIFKPLLMNVPLPALGPRPTDRFDVGTLWWRHERFHRAAVLCGAVELLDEICTERDALEAEFAVSVRAVLSGSSSERAGVVTECWSKALAAEERWYRRIDSGALSRNLTVDAAWAKMNQIAGVEFFAQTR